MKEATKFRNGKNIHGINKDGSMAKRNPEVFESINLAKKASVKLQMANDGALGRGSVRVV